MCNCRQTPLQKVERQIQTSGWARLAGSQMTIIDQFIFSMLGVYPSTNEERPDLYSQAKQAERNR